MRRAFLWIAASLAVALFAGCSGGGGGNLITRYLVGYVYVKSSSYTGTGPAAIITASNQAPPGYFPASAGSVTLNVADGTLVGRAPAAYTRQMSNGNDLIVSASAASPYNVSVSGSGLTYSGGPQPPTITGLSSYSEDLSTGGGNGTTYNMASPGSPTYTPGLPASIVLRVDGGSPPPNMVSGKPGGYSLAIAVFDNNNVGVPGVNFGVGTNDGPRISFGTSNLNTTTSDGNGGSIQLLPAAPGSGITPGTVRLTVNLFSSSNNLTEFFDTNFNYGTATTVTWTPSNSSLSPFNMLWDDLGGTSDTRNYTANVKNEFGANMLGQTVNYTTSNAPSNTWVAPAAGSCFSSTSGVTNAAGNTPTVTVSAPTPAGPVAPPNAPPKFLNGLVATSGSASGTTFINIIRPLGSLTVAGPSRLNIGQNTSHIDATKFRVTAAADIDSFNYNQTQIDSLTYSWEGGIGAISAGNVNVNGSLLPALGNTGDTSLPSTSVASISGTGSVASFSAGGTAGQSKVRARVGTVFSNTLTTEIFGVPSKIILSPDTNQVGSNQYQGSVGGTDTASYTIHDSFGHAISLGERNPTSYTGSTNSASNSSINPISGNNIASFTITYGTVGVGGNFTVTFSGTWDGTANTAPQAVTGGSNHVFSVSRTVGLSN